MANYKTNGDLFWAVHSGSGDLGCFAEAATSVRAELLALKDSSTQNVSMLNTSKCVFFLFASNVVVFGLFLCVCVLFSIFSFFFFLF